MPGSGASDLVGLPSGEAIPLLFERFGEKIYRLGLHQCGGREEEAGDLVQETFTAAFRKWDQFEGRSAPSSWLYTIAVRICGRRHRKRAGEPDTLLSLDSLLPNHAEPAATPPEPGDPLAEAIRHEVREAVDRGIARLPSDYRLPLLLKEIAELPVAEVAAILGLKEATVKTRLHRARLMLRKELDERLPKADLPAPDHERSICLDLLYAKQEAMDRGVAFAVPEEELCARCQALFATLDLTQEICRTLHAEAGLPAEVRDLVARLGR